jgi:hypothetical protein
MTHPASSLLIKHAWNGEPLERKHWITLHLILSKAALEIRVSAPFYGDPPAPEAPPGPVDRLWEHEVVEVFAAGPGTRYTEIELAPTGHHLVLKLDGVRHPVETLLDIAYEARIEKGRWTGKALIPADLLPAGPLRVNATAIHGSDEERKYLSWLSLPGEVPDFHQPDRFRPLPESTLPTLDSEHANLLIRFRELRWENPSAVSPRRHERK